MTLCPKRIVLGQTSYGRQSMSQPMRIVAPLWKLRRPTLRRSRSIVISQKWRLILASRPPMHLFHKTFQGTSDKISHCAKLHSSSCLISWLPNIRSCGLVKWESTFFSQHSALLNFSLYSSQTVYLAHTFQTTLWYAWHVSGVIDRSLMSLVSLTGIWCHWHNFSISNKSVVFLAALWWPWHFSGLSDTSVMSPKCLLFYWHISNVPNKAKKKKSNWLSVMSVMRRLRTISTTAITLMTASCSFCRKIFKENAEVIEPPLKYFYSQKGSHKSY